MSNKLNKKIKLYEAGMNYINRVECAVCGELVKKNNMIMGNSTNSTNSHFIKCMANKMGDI